MLRPILVWMLAPTLLYAAEPAGVVMRVDEKELFVNLGERDGVFDTTRLNLYRRVTLTHPITKKTVEDRFPIGQVEVSEAGALLSIVRSFSNLTRPPAEGDFAVVAREGAPDVVVASPGSGPGNGPENGPENSPGNGSEASREVPTHREAAEGSLYAVLEQNLGLPPAAQAAGLRVWREAYPAHRLTPAVDQAIASLQAQAHAPEPPTSPKTRPKQALTTRHVPVRNIEAGRTLELSVAVVEADRVMEVRLLLRRAGAGPWTTLVMAPGGDHHWRQTVPPALLATPGVLEYALEAVHHDGHTEAIGNDLLRPTRLVIEPRPAGSDPPGASHAEFVFRRVDFNTGGQGADQYWQAEAQFRYHVRWKALHAVEAGVGLLDGEGGTVEGLAAGVPSEQLALGYAFAALELSLGEFVGLGGRITGGNHRAAADGTSEQVFGLQGQLRVGDDAGTHLRLGVAALDDLGSRFFADFVIRALDRVPITASAEATNLPVDADYGLRLTGDVGWQATDWLTIEVELGWNARTINHYGFTTGLGLAMDWE